MTKGIREFTTQKFVELLPQRAELGNTKFRAAVMQAAVEAFGISINSAATHYNHSFKTVRAENPELVEGLGRAEDKKGGRPVVHAVTVIKVKTGEVVATGISRAAATTLIARAAGAGKVELKIQEPSACRALVLVADPEAVV